MSYTKVSSISFPVRTQGRNWYSSGSPPSYTSSSRTFTATRTRTGDRLANWRELILKGEDATTTLTGTWDTVDYMPWPLTTQTWYRQDLNLYLYKELKGDVPLVNDIVNSDFFNPTVDTSFVDNLARARFYKQVHSQTRKFQGLVFLGELDETLRMLRKPARGLWELSRDFLDRVKRRKKISPKDWSKHLSDLWLEQAFGWRPLINDCQDLVKAWKALTAEKQDVVRISASASKLYDVSSSALNSGERVGTAMSGLDGSDMQVRSAWGLGREHVFIRYRGAVSTQVGATAWQDWTLFGFNPYEFVPAAWELLPWSFLVDYFTNIGDLLDASVTSVCHTSYVCKTVVQTCNKQVVLKLNPTYRGIASDPNWKLISTVDYGPRWHNLTRKKVSRTRQSGVSAPSFQFNWELNDGQLLNVAALINQAGSIHRQNSPRPWSADRRKFMI